MVSILINSLTEGGAEKVVLTLLEEFRRAEVDIELICLEKDSFYPVPAGIKVTYLADKFEDSKGLMKLMGTFSAAKKLKAHVKKYKVELVQSHLIRSGYVNVMAQMLGSTHRSQIVNHMMLGDDKKGFYNHVLIKKLYAKADTIVSISRMMRIHWNKLFQFPNKHIVISNPHNLDEITTKAEQESEQFIFRQDRRYISFAGRLIPLKRVDDLIHALAEVRKHMPDLELIVMGDGPEKDKLIQLADSLSVLPYVHFMGKVSNPFAIMARSDIFALCSDTEGLPNVLIEALACGTPIISSDCKSGPREILQPDSEPDKTLNSGLEVAKYGLLYAVGEQKELANGIMRLLLDDELHQNYVFLGRERAMDFEASEIVQTYIKSFSDINVFPSCQKSE